MGLAEDCFVKGVCQAIEAGQTVVRVEADESSIGVEVRAVDYEGDTLAAVVLEDHEERPLEEIEARFADLAASCLPAESRAVEAFCLGVAAALRAGHTVDRIEAEQVDGEIVVVAMDAHGSVLAAASWPSKRGTDLAAVQRFFRAAAGAVSTWKDVLG